ncbi:MAG: mismatch-specific DNA-glycosylase [Deltaproteobacteria bacterium]|nr:mismatch-specific DNA-glycosylase [Deltaproteobacteria bacterium]
MASFRVPRSNSYRMSKHPHAHRPLPDYLARGLKLLFVGINPGFVSSSAGHYYANPRNSFWRLLHEAGLTSDLLGPEEDARMPALGYGLTDMVKRPSRGAGDLKTAEFVAGRKRLTRLVRQFKPRAVCFNSKTAFEGYFGKGSCRSIGPQEVSLVSAPVFVLPSTSPANAAVPLAVKKRYFRALKTWLDELDL